MAHSSSSRDESSHESKFDPYEHLNVALNPDGTLTRFVHLPTTPATGEVNANVYDQAVLSKDVVLDAEKKTSLRIYRPTKIHADSVPKLPIMFYFHSGGWILFSIENTMVHENCNLVSAEVPAIVISVEFRLAPESRLPAQYEDAVDAIKWLHNQAVNQNGDPWLRDYGDFSRCYLYGTSAGANIAFNAALRSLDMKLEPLSIVGMILNQPLFGGNKRTKSELKLAADPFFPLPVIDLLWELALPHGTDRDHRYCNPLVDGVSMEKLRSIGRTLVVGFGGDPLIDRQQAFVRMLLLHGVQVEARFDDVGFHGIDLIDSRRTAAVISFLKEFV